MSAQRPPLSAPFLDVSRDLLARGCQVRFQAFGSSMYPTIRDRETITVVPTDASAVRTGDIVLYRLDQGVIAHRVVGVERDRDGALTLLLRGDAADEPDRPVGSQQLLGKVVCVDRAGRRVRLTGRLARFRQALRAGASRARRLIPRGGARGVQKRPTSTGQNRT